jgi:transcription elongation factor Elf1
MEQIESVSSSLTRFATEASTIDRCPNCESNQVMHVRGVYPMLFRGQNVALLQCATCGLERTVLS